MKVPINIPLLGKEEIIAVKRVLQKGILTSSGRMGGNEVQEFENSLSAFVKSKFAVAVNSGTAALQAALYALDIKKGDEVLLPSFTFVATANSIVSVGAKPIFVDIVKNNFTMDPNELRKKITKKSKAIIPVHLYGNVAYIEEIKEIANRFDLKIIEDAAQSLGSTFKNKHTGTFADIGCFSLYPAKVITSGEGGAIVTNNKNLYTKLQLIRNHGMVKGYDTKTLGLNLRMPEINAAIAKTQLKKLTHFLKQRRKNAKILSELISSLDIKMPKERKHEKVNWYLYTIATNKRNRLMKNLNSAGIGATSYYSLPVHKTPYYYKKTKLPNTDWASSTVLSLPVHPAVTTKQLSLTSKIIYSTLKK